MEAGNIEEYKQAIDWLVRAEYYREMAKRSHYMDAAGWREKCTAAFEEAKRLPCVAEAMKKYVIADEAVPS